MTSAKGVSIMLERIHEAERRAGRFLVRAQVDAEGTLSSAEFAEFGPGDLVLSVWNCQVELCLAQRTLSGGYTLEEVLPERDYENERVQRWLRRALEAAGGAITWSGHYPVVIRVPLWLQRRMARR